MVDAGTQAVIAQAHHAAIRDTIALLEDRVSATRVGAGGIAQMPIVGMIATAFDHYDSRAAGPQLHTHVVVSNKVQGEEGRWSTLDSLRLHRATVALSASYNAFLTDQTARLFGVTWVPVDRGKDRNTDWEIEGVSAGLIAEFSLRATGGSNDGEGIEQVKNRLIEQYLAEHGRWPSSATIAKQVDGELLAKFVVTALERGHEHDRRAAAFPKPTRPIFGRTYADDTRADNRRARPSSGDAFGAVVLCPWKISEFRDAAVWQGLGCGELFR